MMNNWKVKQIKDIGKVITGKTPRTADEDNFGDEYLFLTPSDMGGQKKIYNTDRKLSEKGAISVKSCKIYANSICVSCIGWQMGKVVLIAEEGFTNQQINTIIPNNSVIPDFVYYNFSLRREELMTLASGGTRTPILKKSLFEKLEILLPPLQTQQKIASILSAYDELIENNTRQIKILEEMAQLIYREWFVKFKFPNHENVAMVESELGLIPEGWEVKRLEDFGKILTGKTPSKKVAEYYGNYMPFIKTPDMHGNLFCIQTTEYLSEKGVQSQVKKILPPNSLCVSCIGTVGVVTITAVNSQTNQQINSIILDDNSKREFLYFALVNLKEIIEQYGANGATMINLNKSKFEALTIIYPNDILLEQFHKITCSMFENIKLMQIENINLRKTRDLLLPKLISGEIDVEELNIKIRGEVE